MVNEYIKKYKELLLSKKSDIEALKSWFEVELADLKSGTEATYNPDKGTLSVVWPDRLYFLRIAFLPKEERWVCVFADKNTNSILIQKDYADTQLEILKDDFAKTIASLYV